MSGARAAGSYLYSEGYRLCVMCSGGKALRKTMLQSSFGDFGHIVQIETPKSNLAFVAFDDNADAKEAMRAMDGKTVDGQIVSVTKAGPKPNYRVERSEMMPPVLMTTQTEREEMSRRANVAWEEKQKRGPGKGRSSSRSHRSPSGQRRSPKGRRSQTPTKSRSRSRRAVRSPTKRKGGRSRSRTRSRQNGRKRSRSRQNGRKRSRSRGGGKRSCSRSRKPSRSRSTTRRRGKGDAKRRSGSSS